MEKTNEQLRKEIDHVASLGAEHWKEATEKASEIEQEIHKLEAELKAKAA